MFFCSSKYCSISFSMTVSKVRKTKLNFSVTNSPTNSFQWMLYSFSLPNCGYYISTLSGIYASVPLMDLSFKVKSRESIRIFSTVKYLVKSNVIFMGWNFLEWKWHFPLSLNFLFLFSHVSWNIHLFTKCGEDEKCFKNWKLLSILNLFLKSAECWGLIVPIELIENEDALKIKPVYLQFVSSSQSIITYNHQWNGNFPFWPN